MVDVRCNNIDDTVWAYVVENARLRKITRCQALEEIIQEHMRFMYKEQKERVEKT
jgi:hypothetical protein